MTNAELADALRKLATEAGPLVCLGCKYEHNYGIHGCDLMREAAERIKRIWREVEALSEGVRDGYVSAPDLIRVLREEYEIDIIGG